MQSVMIQKFCLPISLYKFFGIGERKASSNDKQKIKIPLPSSEFLKKFHKKIIKTFLAGPKIASPGSLDCRSGPTS